MIAGIGIDVVDVERLREILLRRGKSFQERIFTVGEREYCERQKDPALHYAARFAAKESCLKALSLGIGSLRWTEMEVIVDPSGKPGLRLTGKALQVLKGGGVERILLSLSHTKREAVAVVIAEGREK